jgi:ubiquinone/menaquinone biosynthesis C-methylase UbiE
LEESKFHEEGELIASTLFTWLQGADFYHNLHREAVDLLPMGNGKTWMDIGCGPGLVARLAMNRGYQVIGIDSDPQMIQSAKRIAKRQGLSIDFKTGDVFNLSTESADVVSATSLLAVLGNKASGLNSLWKCVRSGGTLLIIEPTNRMTIENANQVVNSGLSRKRINGLRMWATARQGNTIDPAIFETLVVDSIKFEPLLQGLVGAWILYKKA